MKDTASFILRNRNPDILSCIANLSNDEVFTPPELASQMLDTLADTWAKDHGGESIWSNKSIRFLDPCTKSGVFLREITARLIEGLADEFPDLQERVNHILSRQVFGIGITRLTSLLARRSLYCSKSANGKHSVAEGFDDEAGNVWFERTQHTWKGKKCIFCGTSRTVLDRGNEIENYAYPFIHTDDIRQRITEIFGGKMQFDVIIGNPPYQFASDGGTRDVPIYQNFVEQAKALDPKYLSMVIPSRWMTSGLGLTKFRKTMLSDPRICEVVDFPVSKEVFPGVEVKGGICYFLRNSKHESVCNVTTIRGDQKLGPIPRKLDEHDVFVRDSKAVKILEKVLAKQEISINTILARDKEFGWTSNFSGFTEEPISKKDIPLYYIRSAKRRIGFVKKSEVSKSVNLIEKWKVLVPEAGSDGGQKIPDSVLGKPLIAPSPSVCTQSFLFFFVETREEALSIQSYYTTKFFRFLVSLRKITQHATHSSYFWVPTQAWDRVWSDDQLYEKYKLSKNEINYIEQVIRPMEIPEPAIDE